MLIPVRLYRSTWTNLAIYDNSFTSHDDPPNAAINLHARKWSPLCFGVGHGCRDGPLLTDFHFHVSVLLLWKTEDSSRICAQTKNDILG